MRLGEGLIGAEKSVSFAVREVNHPADAPRTDHEVMRLREDAPSPRSALPDHYARPGRDAERRERSGGEGVEPGIRRELGARLHELQHML